MLKKDKTLQAHSKAKATLYSKYLSVYLLILIRTSNIKKINICEFFCGEGIHAKNDKGSAALAIDEIKKILYETPELVKADINFWFNDLGVSEIDGLYKVDKVKDYYESNISHRKVNARFTRQRYEDLYPEIVSLTQKNNGTKNILFVDPCGYKTTDLNNLKVFLQNLNTEILLFLPINQMYRFLRPVFKDKSFSGDEALKNILKTLGINNNEGINDDYDFIDKIKESLTKFLNDGSGKFFVDTFTLESEVKNIYCLFFITPHIAGFEKMLEIKWTLDEEQGRGFRLTGQQQSFFEPENKIKYQEDLRVFLRSKEAVTNGDIYYFGLEKGFLPKHTNEVFKNWKKEGEKFFYCDSLGIESRYLYLKRDNYGENAKKVMYFKYRRFKNGKIENRMDRSNLEPNYWLHKN